MSERRCDDCGRHTPNRNYSRGLCSTCYGRRERHGTLPDRVTIDRFSYWLDLARREQDECWPWAGALTRFGYGRLRVDGKPEFAHRVVHERLIGPIPDGYHIDHVCHTRALDCAGGPACPHRSCVNPAHLEAVIPRENWRRGRSPSVENTRKLRCPVGHRYDSVSITKRDGVVRRCLTCARESNYRGVARRAS